MGEKAGSKAGTHMQTISEIRKHKKERSKRLLLEAHGLVEDLDISKDSKGRYICTLCGTKHLTEVSYVKHRDGKRHRLKSAKEKGRDSEGLVPVYHVRNLMLGGKRGHGITINYELAREMPQYRFVSSLEQSIEEYDDSFRYLVFVCEPYENIGFKFENKEIDELSIYEKVDEESGKYTFHFYFGEAL